ncbi:PhoH family protein, partial [bacterium]|nr:PhoH family protein [bacterium]
MEYRLTFRDDDEALAILGRNDENLRLIKEALGAKIVVRGHDLVIVGREQEEVDVAVRLIEDLIGIYRSGHYLQTPEVKYALRTIKEDKEVDLLSVFNRTLSVSQGGRPISPRTLGQKAYVEAMRKNDIVFGIGPAGTGKTYLAVACAISSLLKKEIARIVLVRPALPAGEELGFLPGDLQEKVSPYLRPLYDAIYDMMGVKKFSQLLS